MELTFTRQSVTQVALACDDQFSHSFDLRPLLLQNHKDEEELLNDPMTYGKNIYDALFPPQTLAYRALAMAPERILIVTTDHNLDAVPWEFAYGPDGFLVLECHFVRGLPSEQRIAAPTLAAGLHIVAVPSNPLSHELEPLNIDGEWMRLKDIIQDVPYAIGLERTHPATLEQVRDLVANQRQRVVHFMGHGGQSEQGAVLCFEQENGDLDAVAARQFVHCVRDAAFLVVLNACASATPGPTLFSNLADALVKQRIPYALGMRFSVSDDEARTFSRVFYNDLARGTSVEEALQQARLTLFRSSRPWAFGVPVLYTSLAQPATGFAPRAGSPLIEEYRPHIEFSALPRAEGTFQGRIDELKALGAALTGGSRPPLVTIHGAGGQGKTALAREIVERFAFAWPGGVWATSLENLPGRELFVNDLARFLDIDTQKTTEPDEVERLVIARLAHRRTLIVLDNAETLVEAVEANNEAAIRLAQFLRERLPRQSVSLLATSRSFLQWTGERGYELRGLASIEGIRLFQQHIPQRLREIDRVEVWKLIEKVDGHPLSLRLLGSAFNTSADPFDIFVQKYEKYLLRFEDKYKDIGHRHRTLNAAIETSLHYLDADLLALFSRLWLFHDPFLPLAAIATLDADYEKVGVEHSAVSEQLLALWQRGLLTREGLPEQETLLYRVPAVIRSYIERYLVREQERNPLLLRYGHAYAGLAHTIYTKLNQSMEAPELALLCRDDLERGIVYAPEGERGHYLLWWGWILHYLGDRRRGLSYTEHALRYSQEQARASNQRRGQEQTEYRQALELTISALNNMALMYNSTGHRQEALRLCEQILDIKKALGKRPGDGSTLNNIALVYFSTGRLQEALKLYEQVLSIYREAGSRAGEGTVLNNIATTYSAMGRPQEALKLYEQALPIYREAGNRVSEGTALNNMALIYLETGRPEQALSLYEQVLAIVRGMHNRAEEATALHNSARALFNTGRLQEALYLFDEALLIELEVGDRAGEANTFVNKGMVLEKLGRTQEALQLYEQALPVRIEVGDRSGVATTLSMMARICSATGQLQRALQLIEQALPIHREVGDRKGVGVALSTMAEVYYKLGRMEEVLSLFEQTLVITREIGDRAGEARALNSIALLYNRKGRQREALDLYQQALLINQEVGDRIGEATTLHNLAGVFDDLGRSEKALSLFTQVLLIRREVGDCVGEGMALAEMATTCGHMGRHEESLLLYTQALAAAKEVGDRTIEATVLSGMADAYIYTNRLLEAYTAWEMALNILRQIGLTQDLAGRTTEKIEDYLRQIREGTHR